MKEPALAAEYESALGLALTRIDQVEKVLVLFGAGTAEDAHLAEGLVPEAREVGVGKSVAFEL